MRRQQQKQQSTTTSNNNNNKKKPSSNERTSTGNTWEEQDDLFFGGSSSSTTTPSTNNVNGGTSTRMGLARSYAGICPPCPPQATETFASQRRRTTNRVPDKDKNEDGGNDGGGGKRNFNWSSKIASSRNRIASLADKASSHISDRINDLQQQQQQQQSQRHSQRHTGAGNTGGSKGTRAVSSPSPTVASLPPPSSPQARTTTSRPTSRPTNNPNIPPPSQRRRNISNMVQTALISQIPLQCKICNSIPLMYQCHPFFGPKERICSTHVNEEIIKCVSCFRFEPKHSKFARIGISNAKVCPACARTAVLDNGSATTVYWEILRFLSQGHGLDLFEGKMESIPVQLVDEATLNSKSSSIDCNPNAQKRGLCVWSESHYGLNLPNLSNLSHWMGGIGGIGAGGSSRRTRRRNSASRNDDVVGGGAGDVPTNRSVGMRHVTVQSIYCLKGLPRSLMGSILAHEAMHAWFGLNPLRRDGVVGEESHGEIRRIPPVVEEGLCQLASHLYLNHVMDLESAGTSDSGASGGGGGGGPSDDKLREYFRWSIETDSSPVYGDGFRMAAMAYNEICDNGGSLMDLLQYAMMHKALPC